VCGWDSDSSYGFNSIEDSSIQKDIFRKENVYATSSSKETKGKYPRLEEEYLSKSRSWSNAKDSEM
jgi:hypothetical protein